MHFINDANITNSTEPSTVESITLIEQYEETRALYIFRVTLFSGIISASLIGNSMVFYAVRAIPSRKPLSYHLVANLALAEILSSVCLAVMFASWQNPTNAALQEAACVLNTFQVIALLVVTYSLAAIAFYRYRYIVKPLPRGPSVKKIIILTIAGLWLLSFAIACPFFIGLRFRNGRCIELPITNNEYYAVIRFILNYALPYVIMLASYGAVAWNLKRRIVQINQRKRTSTADSSCVVQVEDQMELQDLGEDARMKEQRSSVLDKNSRRDSKPENTDPEKDLLRMIFVLIIIFVVCYFPYQAHYVWERVCKINAYQFRHHQLFMDYNFILICLPSALHPLCYGTMNSFFAKAFSKIILCRSYE